jgi:DUF1707 SHOCT-like domain
VVTVNTRATDSDRNDTCQVLDYALSEGQLSMDEHRQRVSAATTATTLGELQSLVSDLQIHSAPTQLPTLMSPVRRRTIGLAVAAVLALLGAGIAWGLLGNNSSPSNTTSASSTTVNGPGSLISSTTPPQAPQQLLTIGGLTGFLAQMQRQFGDTLGYELVVSSDNAVLTRPDSVNAHETVQWSYINGGWINNSGARLMPPNTTVGDLSKFDVKEVLGVLRDAPQTLHISNPTTTDLLIDAAKDGSLTLQVMLSEGTNNGYIQLAADGTVKWIVPPSH